MVVEDAKVIFMITSVCLSVFSPREAFMGYNLGFLVTRPLSVDSLNGGSTDAPKKAPVEEKIGKRIVVPYLCFYQAHRKV